MSSVTDFPALNTEKMKHDLGLLRVLKSYV